MMEAMSVPGRRPKTAELLDLAPHPEGGWYRETWRARPESVPDGHYARVAIIVTGLVMTLVATTIS
jgi:uncharacterized protein